MKTYTAAVMGLGKIGMQYDYHLPSDQILTHCSAFSQHPGFELVAGLDAEVEVCRQFEKKYQKTAYTSLARLLEENKPEVLAISVPYLMQPGIVGELLTLHTPKAVILEKPLAPSLLEAKSMIAKLEQQGVITLVNYIRRFEPGAKRVIDAIKNGDIGNLQTVIAWYSKSMKVNGCHVIDFMEHLLTQIQGHCDFRELNEDRAHQQIKVLCNDIPLHLFCSSPHYTRFDIQLIGHEGIIDYCNGGRKILLRKLKRDEVFSHLNVLDQEQGIENDLYRYQWYTQDSLYCALTHKQALPSTGQTALITEQFLAQLTSIQ